MTHPIIKTDNYILITSDEEIKAGDTTINLKSIHNHKELCTIDNDIELERYTKKQGNDCKKVIAHLPLNNSPILEGVPLLPALPNEEIDLATQEYPFLFIEGYKKAKEKYKFTEDDVIKIVEKSRETGLTAEYLMLSLSQPKLPVGFKCRIEYLTSSPIIINGVMQGEWIFE